MFTLGGAKIGVDLLGGCTEGITINDRNSRQATGASAFLRFQQDGTLLTFPPVDDIGITDRQPHQEAQTLDALSGARDQANVGSWDEVVISAQDLSTEVFWEALETWYGSARTGQDFSYGFDDADQVFSCLKVAALKGDTFLELLDTDGIVAGRRYLIRRDLLGANATKNLAPNGGFNTNVSNVSAVGSATITQETTIKTEGAGSCKVVTGGAGANEGMSETITVPARLGYFIFSAKVRGTAALRLRLSWTEDGTARTQDVDFTGSGIFDAQRVKILLPQKTITLFKAQVITQGTVATTFYVDEFQVEQSRQQTPFADSGLTTFSASSAYLEEYVTVREAVPGVGVILRDPLKYPYLPRDVFKSKRYWPRLVMSDPSSVPFRQNLLTVDMEARVREVPA